MGPAPSSIWADRQRALARCAERQLFLVGGAPRSGTTWLQHLLDSHPQISCRGEGLFEKHLAAPLQRLMADRRQALDDKNRRLFSHSGGYPLPSPEDEDVLLATAVLLALARQSTSQECVAVGDKTPENVFFFATMKRLFPGAKFIGILRDPRDILTSAWHFFHKPPGTAEDEAAKFAFVRSAIPILQHGAQTIQAISAQSPSDCLLVTYERMHAAPGHVAGELFDFLGAAADADVVADCVARTSFAALSGGRAADEPADRSFFRKGVVGDWPSTLSPAMNDMILQELGWMFPQFGWQP